MLWIDIKFANMLASNLAMFKVKKTNPYLSNFRCPYCGDSKSNKYRARGYLFEHKGSLVYKCHNCDMATNFDGLLKFIDQEKHKEYSLEKYRERSTQTTFSALTDNKFVSDIGKFSKQRFEKFEPLKKLKKISQLDNNHIAKKYCLQRQIPANKHYILYYCPKFKQFTNNLLPDKFPNLENDRDRLLIPLIDRDGMFFGYQGRALNSDKIRYITIVLDPSKPRVFGLNTIDLKQDVVVVEGPLDSLFLPNAIAMAGGDNGDVEKLGINDKLVFCYDNEPRNEDTIKRMEKMIEKGFRVVVWPNNIVYKDINEMVLNGLCQEEISCIISNNTYNGLSAKLKLQEWKKV